jgi:hypothetical protein
VEREQSPVESPLVVRSTTVSVVACSITTSLVTFGPATDAETSETTSASAAIDAAAANTRIFPS